VAVGPAAAARLGEEVLLEHLNGHPGLHPEIAVDRDRVADVLEVGLELMDRVADQGLSKVAAEYAVFVVVSGAELAIEDQGEILTLTDCRY